MTLWYLLLKRWLLRTGLCLEDLILQCKTNGYATKDRSMIHFLHRGHWWRPEGVHSPCTQSRGAWVRTVLSAQQETVSVWHSVHKWTHSSHWHWVHHNLLEKSQHNFDLKEIDTYRKMHTLAKIQINAQWPIFTVCFTVFVWHYSQSLDPEAFIMCSMTHWRWWLLLHQWTVSTSELMIN